MISDIKRFNRQTETYTFMVAHPNKQIRDPNTGMLKVTSLFSIQGSSHFNNKCDVGIIITRDYEKEETEIRIAKVREHQVQGVIGTCRFKWNDATRCFHPIQE